MGRVLDGFAIFERFKYNLCLCENAIRKLRFAILSTELAAFLDMFQVGGIVSKTNI